MNAGRIYLVEDEAFIAMELEDRLAQLGYDIVGQSGTVDAALPAILAAGPDIAVLDICLGPGGSGIDLAQRLRDQGSEASILYLSAYSDDRVLDLAQATDPAGYLVKPFDLRELHATLQMTLRRRATERENAALRAEQARLERRLLRIAREESLGRMAEALAHSYGNALQGILGLLELARDRNLGADERDHCVAEAIGEVQRAARISDALRQYAGQPAGPSRTIDLPATCERLCSLIGPLLPATTIVHRCDVPGLLVRLDESRLRDVLLELLCNAAEAMPERQGVVEVISAVRPAAALAGARTCPADWVPSDAEYATVRVCDQGPGIPPEHLEHLFEPFFSTRFINRGLGLARVLAAARSLGGAVVVNSEPGKGSVFEVVLPLPGRGPGGVA